MPGPDEYVVLLVRRPERTKPSRRLFDCRRKTLLGNLPDLVIRVLTIYDTRFRFLRTARDTEKHQVQQLYRLGRLLDTLQVYVSRET